MLARLTIDRPVALGEALVPAVHAVCSLPLSVAPQHLTRLDARLACGDFESVLSLVRTAAPHPALPIFVARFVRWTGDLQSAAGMWSSVLASLDQTLGDTADPTLRRDSSVELAATATDLGDVRLAARLHAVARTTGTPSSRPVERDADVLLVGHAAFNVVGIEPDAARGRLRLRPRLDRLDELSVRHIRFGDASVSLHAARAHDRLTIRCEQDAGSIPVTLLLEPFVLRPIAASVDGQAADLAVQHVAEPEPIRWPERDPDGAAAGTVLPVQLILDEARTLIIDFDPAP